MNWFVWLLSNTNVHKFISKSCYLLLENERHPTIYRGHTAKYISQDLNADNENRTLYNLLLISHLFVYYIFFLINFASFPFFGFFCGSSSVKVVSFCAKLSRLPSKIQVRFWNGLLLKQLSFFIWLYLESIRKRREWTLEYRNKNATLRCCGSPVNK